jgi:hypothetical protein
MSLNKISNKINNIIETYDMYNVYNVIKVIIILVALLLIYRIFTSSSNNDNYNMEGFENIGSGIIYGNSLSLKNRHNIPTYSGNKCIMELDGSSRIDTLKLIFNTGANSYATLSNKKINIQFQDVNGNMKYIKNPDNNESPPFFEASNNNLVVSDIKDESSISVYTSKIIIVVGDESNKMDSFLMDTNTPFIKEFGIFGSDRKMPVKIDYDNMATNLQNVNFSVSRTNAVSYDLSTKTDIYSFTNLDNKMIYAIKINTNQRQVEATTPAGATIPTTTKTPTTTQTPTTTSAPTTTGATSTIDATTTTGATITTGETTTTKAQEISVMNTDGPFIVKIKYYNSYYPDNEFTLNKTFIVRNDNNRLSYQISEYLFLSEPIIANKIIFEVQRVNIINSIQYKKLEINGLTVNGKNPLPNEITDYKRNVNLQVRTDETTNGANICPSINEIADQQSKTQKICDNIEYQDKIKSEKLRLERNKQYLIKLKEQQENIDQLNNVIQDLESKRQSRNQLNEKIKVLQYDQQKDISSRIRDLANERLKSQDINNLYLDVKFNTNV